MLAVSCDDVESHRGWIPDVDAYGNTKVQYPIVADADRRVARMYNMLPAEESGAPMPVTVRSVFFIDDQRRIKAMITYPPAVGRNFDEILRAVDALQTSARLGVATPVDWRRGDEVIVPLAVPDENVKQNFPDGLLVVDLPSQKPYLRTGKYPG